MESSTPRVRQDKPIYIPAHRRTGSLDPDSVPAPPAAPGADTSDGVVKRGRGSFHGKSNGSSNAHGAAEQQQQPHSPRGRNFDATVLRTYSDGGRRKSGGNDGANPRRNGRGSNRRNTNNADGSTKPAANGNGASGQGSDDSDDTKAPSPPAHQNGTSDVVPLPDDSAVDRLADCLAGSSLSSPTSESPSSQKEEWELLMEREPLAANGKPLDDENGVTVQRKGSNASTKQKKRRASRIEILPEGAEAPSPEEPTFVLDCYDFPASFKTHHLHDIFREYESMRGGYRIKWLEDTRALIIFEHPSTAKKAYLDNVANPLTKIRPYTGPISIKQLASPPRRPPTTDMVAKRLVAGALGVKVTKTPEQKAAEKAVLQTARDQRDQQRNHVIQRAQDLDNAFAE